MKEFSAFTKKTRNKKWSNNKNLTKNVHTYALNIAEKKKRNSIGEKF